MFSPQPAPQSSGGQLLAPEDAMAVRRAADMTRARALMSVAAGQSTIWDILAEAAMPAGRPLLRLSLRQLLLAQPHCGERTAKDRLDSLSTTMGLPIGLATRSATLQWLLDPRSSGHRMLAFIDVMDGRGGRTPWTGFPFAPPASTESAVVLGAFA